MIKNIKIVWLSLFIASLMAWPNLSLAQDANPLPATNLLDRLQNVGNQAGFVTDQSVASTPLIIGTVIGAFLGFLGIVFIVLIVVAGFTWMTANGNEEKVKKATITIKNALLGLILALSAWSLWNFIFKKLIS